ncbi:sensor histidine kinase [Undibacterium sp. Ji83W]|uniref:sensor histidine kinase n=1 Tax=Undibacterium sp. Ji83W TaxID=3413043 RepID=UPI003BF31CDB
MTMPILASEILAEGTLGFTIESRVIRELGERLVKQPEIAILELIKNSYDADSTRCVIEHISGSRISVSDDGHGMTLENFTNGWMRIGTSSKESQRHSKIYERVITGEKGIGRFAVRFLGRELSLESIADDPNLGFKTHLVANFNWPEFDKNEDIGKVKVPYRLHRAEDNVANGTRLIISRLRPSTNQINYYKVRTASIDVVTPFHALLQKTAAKKSKARNDKRPEDPGFSLKFLPSVDAENRDLSLEILDHFVLRAKVSLEKNLLTLEVYRNGETSPNLKIVDNYESNIGKLFADIRFFPQRKGTFINMPVDGRIAKTWVKENSGVAVFDRTFRVHPYGTEGDDWLSLSADAVKRSREPRSSIAKKHFPMDDQTRNSTKLNYMLRMPYSQQLIGVVQVAGRRSQDALIDDEGLIASADREGFVDNETFRQLTDLIRGAVEAIAASDRELQLEMDRAKQESLLNTLKNETNEAIREIRANPNISRDEKVRIVKTLAQTQVTAEKFQEQARQREETLEVMSLLGVVAGFMTHEFGTALNELEKAQRKILTLTRSDPSLKEMHNSISEHLASLREFVTYSQGYIQGASVRPTRPYPVRPRLQQVIRVFGKYATDRHIEIDIGIDGELMAPLVPVSLYNGIALNLFTNAIKAVTAKSGADDRKITFRAWNDQHWHHLEVADTGIGIPSSLRKRVFEPLFTTTSSNRDPLGSGLGLGMALIKRGAESYGGKVEVVDPPAGFSTCVHLRLPLEGSD